MNFPLILRFKLIFPRIEAPIIVFKIIPKVSSILELWQSKYGN
uniref:Uncharacterized protein n=1 Tax=Arundo donax TaxID=35708 RepID=A0A0A9BEN4_ARUDO